jgi:hypothetical protein
VRFRTLESENLGQNAIRANREQWAAVVKEAKVLKRTVEPMNYKLIK